MQAMSCYATKRARLKLIIRATAESCSWVVFQIKFYLVLQGGGSLVEVAQYGISSIYVSMARSLRKYSSEFGPSQNVLGQNRQFSLISVINFLRIINCLLSIYVSGKILEEVKSLLTIKWNKRGGASSTFEMNLGSIR